MTPRLVEIHCADEVPRLGQGRRLVYAEVGRKWVRMKDAAGRVARVHRRLFDRIVLQDKEARS